MDNLITTCTRNGNCYYLDTKNKLVGIAHPLFLWMSERMKEKGHLKHLPGKILFNPFGTFNKKEINYYRDKFLFLFRNSEDKEIEKENNNKPSFRLLPSMLEYKIANLNQITLEITERCNLNCVYCGYGHFYDDYDPRKNTDMSYLTAKSIIDYFSEYWNSCLNSSFKGISYISFYGGEPLLRYELIRWIIDYVSTKKINRNIRYNMTTNGVLLDKHISFLVDNDVQVVVSLDGDIECNSYRIFRNGKNSFNKIMRNLMSILNKYPDYFRDNAFFNTVLHNKNSVDKVIRFFNKEFGKTPNITELSESGISKQKALEFREMFKSYLLDLNQSDNCREIKDALFANAPDIRSLTFFMSLYSGNFYRSYSDLFIEPSDRNEFPTGTCMPFGKKIFVTSTGKILPCERINHCYTLGEVNDNYVDINFKDISISYNQYLSKIEPICNSCYDKDSCMQCIFHIDSLLKKKVVCPKFKSLREFKSKFADAMACLEENPSLYSTIIKKVLIE